MAAQYVDLKNSEQVQPHALLDVRGDYHVLRYVDLLLYCRNLLDETYYVWDHYSEIPLSVLGGISTR